MITFTGSPISSLSLVLGSFALSSSILVSAETAPGAVADVPLVTQGGAKPNLMIMLDSSGSMDSKLDSGEKRIDVVKRAAKGLVDSLGDGSMRVGLSRFNGSEGARILYNLTLLDTTEKTNIKDGIDGIPASGVTPLAEAASDIGRYFTYGYAASKDLTLHPENSFNQTAAAKPVSDIFEDQPDFKSGLNAPSASVQYYCQKNFFMLLTDGEPNGDFDVSTELQDYDGDCTATGDDSDCRTHYSGNGSDYLDDVTTAMYDMDLRPDLVGPDSSKPVKNNVSSYMVGFAEGSLANNPLLKSAAEQAGGKFLYASDSDALETAFQSILTDIFSKVGASSAASFNATSLSSDSVIYLASYNSEKWSGSLVAREFDPITGKFNSTDKWRAQTVLDGRSTSTRLILTSEDGVGKAFEIGLIGTDSANPATPQQADLDINSATAGNDERGDERLNYIRGVRSNEGTGSTEFRLRDTALGDIVNSTPTYVGEPNFNYPDTDPFGGFNNRYSDFVAAAADRDPIVYVGANDGMLHGFDASTGEEKIAYIPELLLSTEATEGLHYLTSRNYGHRFYVNLTPTVADAFFDDDWHTVLVGGLGAGGKGYFILDVTDPDDFTSGNASRIVMDEIGADDDDMGLSFSRPKVALLNNGRWAAIFGNGYNSVSGKALLYLYYFDNGEIKKIDTGWTDANGNGEKNGLSTPSLADVNGDGVVDRVYAGDVQGNMWAFDLCSLTNGVCSSADSSWSRDYAGPLFTTGTNAEPEPITTAPRIAKNTQMPNGPYPNLLVLFGSGQYLNSADLQDTDATAYYGVWDKGDDDLDSSDLVTRSFSVQSGKRTMSAAADPVDWFGGEYGWKIPLQAGSTGIDEVTGGERVITESLLLGSVLFFNTAIPSTAVCSSGGTGYLMNVDFRTGLAPEVGVFDGNGDGVIDDADKGYVGELASSLDDERGGGGIPTDPAMIRNSGSGGSGQFCINVSGDPDCGPREWYVGKREGRLSWQEISPF